MAQRKDLGPTPYENRQQSDNNKSNRRRGSAPSSSKQKNKSAYTPLDVRNPDSETDQGVFFANDDQENNSSDEEGTSASHSDIYANSNSAPASTATSRSDLPPAPKLLSFAIKTDDDYLQFYLDLYHRIHHTPPAKDLEGATPEALTSIKPRSRCDYIAASFVEPLKSTGQYLIAHPIAVIIGLGGGGIYGLNAGFKGKYLAEIYPKVSTSMVSNALQGIVFSASFSASVFRQIFANFFSGATITAIATTAAINNAFMTYQTFAEKSDEASLKDLVGSVSAAVIMLVYVGTQRFNGAKSIIKDRIPDYFDESKQPQLDAADLLSRLDSDSRKQVQTIIDNQHAILRNRLADIDAIAELEKPLEEHLNGIENAKLKRTDVFRYLLSREALQQANHQLEETFKSKQRVLEEKIKYDLMKESIIKAEMKKFQKDDLAAWQDAVSQLHQQGKFDAARAKTIVVNQFLMNVLSQAGQYADESQISVEKSRCPSFGRDWIKLGITYAVKYVITPAAVIASIPAASQIGYDFINKMANVTGAGSFDDSVTPEQRYGIGYGAGFLFAGGCGMTIFWANVLSKSPTIARHAALYLKQYPEYILSATLLTANNLLSGMAMPTSMIRTLSRDHHLLSWVPGLDKPLQNVTSLTELVIQASEGNTEAAIALSLVTALLAGATTINVNSTLMFFKLVLPDSIRTLDGIILHLENTIDNKMPIELMKRIKKDIIPSLRSVDATLFSKKGYQPVRNGSGYLDEVTIDEAEQSAVGKEGTINDVKAGDNSSAVVLETSITPTKYTYGSK